VPEVLKDEKAATLMDGKELAKLVKDELKVKIERHTQKGKRAPGLAVILAGDDPASAIYVKNKVKSCEAAGIESFFHKFPADVTEKELIDCVEKLNKDDKVDGILVQLPLPGKLSADNVLDHLDPAKDADGLHPYNLGLLFCGKKGPTPCTPKGVMRLLEQYKIDPAGKNAVVIGRSNLVGKPAAALLTQKNATVTVCHSKTANLSEVCAQADILVVAMGKREFVRGSWIKPGAVVIDVGIHHSEGEGGAKGKIAGDVCFEEAKAVASHITPVPGGVGPMTVAMLLANTLENYERKTGAAD
jgi:methylenetetrahydrofolate dehydrogenase (NADP+)/methenyltetrahydrofolate cyclohydrolase